jgi:hypothetical protein
MARLDDNAALFPSFERNNPAEGSTDPKPPLDDILQALDTTA